MLLQGTHGSGLRLFLSLGWRLLSGIDVSVAKYFILSNDRLSQELLLGLHDKLGFLVQDLLLHHAELVSPWLCNCGSGVDCVHLVRQVCLLLIDFTLLHGKAA